MGYLVGIDWDKYWEYNEGIQRGFIDVSRIIREYDGNRMGESDDAIFVVSCRLIGYLSWGYSWAGISSIFNRGMRDA